MPSVTLTSLTGGGGLPRLAPDLTYPSTLVAGTTYTQVTINPMGALTTALSLTGKFLISNLDFSGLTAETITVKLTVDGVVIWNSTFTSSTTLSLLNNSTNGGVNSFPFQCSASMLLQLQTATDTSVNLRYSVRPIL